MGQKRMPGLIKRNGIWHIEKQIQGRRFRESTGANNLQEAEKYLIKRLEEIREAKVYGIRPKRTFREAATKFLKDYEHLASISDYALQIKILDKYIGKMALDNIDMDSLKEFIEARKADGVKKRTINYALQTIRRILRLAADEWKDENKLTWLIKAPKINLLPLDDAREPEPLTWQEQERFFKKLPVHLQKALIFKVNTGLREQNVCKLQWEWEIKLPTLKTSVFIIPPHLEKNRTARLVILNDVARTIVEEQRGKHPTHIFSYKGKPFKRLGNGAWLTVRKELGLTTHIHDLKHTFGSRLRAAGVSFEDRQDLLGHKSERITTHYSVAQVAKLIEAANKASVVSDDVVLTITQLLNKSMPIPAKSPQ